MKDSPFLAITIHNNSVGRISAHDSKEGAILELTARIELQLNRKMTGDEIFTLENDESFYDESDSDNILSWEINYIGEGILAQNARERAEKEFQEELKKYYLGECFEDIPILGVFKFEMSLWTKIHNYYARKNDGEENGGEERGFNPSEVVFVKAA